MRSLLFHPQVQVLEHRVLLTQVVVRNTNNSGPDSFRQAIIDVNKLPGGEIDFNIPGAAVHTIAPDLNDPLPAITSPAVIDATTQPGYTPETPLIELSGVNVGDHDGLVFDPGSEGSVVEGMVINSFQGPYPSGNALRLRNAGDNVISGNFIGTDALGAAPMRNDKGIWIERGCNSNTIGGECSALRNLISGNGTGVWAFSEGNVIKGNYVGTDVSGIRAVGNSLGIELAGSNNVVGGTTAADRNVISGNSSGGLGLFNADNNVVAGNYIGIDVTGTAALANGIGLIIQQSSHGNLIGGNVAGAGNIISGNSGLVGLGLFQADDNRVEGNFIGTDATGSRALPNAGSGVLIEASFNNTIGGTSSAQRNLISGNSHDGVLFQIGSRANVVEGNYIGTDDIGAVALPNRGIGVHIQDRGTNTIGGTAEGARNLISGNAKDGIVLDQSDQNLVAHNYIGTDVQGTRAVPNGGNGITVVGGTAGNTITGNVVSGNGKIGIEISQDQGSTTRDILVQGNYIGTDASATSCLPNNGGIAIDGFAQDNTIGGTTAAARNIISGNRSYGVAIFDRLTTGNLVEGNYIGTDLTGTQAIPNDEGVDIFDAASGNTIGGTGLGCTRNLISGNSHEGVHIFDRDTSDVVQNNYIGTDMTGTRPLANGFGVSITGGASGNLIGGTTLAGTMNSGARNIISGNVHYGVGLLDSHTSSNVIQGNYIGTDVSGTLRVGNGDDGVLLPNGGLSGAANENMVGGSGSGEGNIIAYNGGDGVRIDTGTGNSLRANSIFGHTNTDRRGIELVNAGNNGQAGPRLKSVTSDGTYYFIRGSLRSTPDTMFTLEFFSNPDCDPSGLGEGETFLGMAPVMTDALGFVRFQVNLRVGPPRDQFVTATATSLSGDTSGDTSEFSNCQVVTASTSPDISFPDEAELARGAAPSAVAAPAATTVLGTIPPASASSAVDRYFTSPGDREATDLPVLTAAPSIGPGILEPDPNWAAGLYAVELLPSSLDV
jgi:titin